MIALNNIKCVYMLGIGGIGMSAVAQYFLSRGVSVSGYDVRPTPLTQKLEQQGIDIHYEEDIHQINEKADIIIYTPAIPKTHKEFIYLKEKKYTLMKRSEVLGLITKNLKSVCVAGTHGKTTISTMTAYLLREGGVGGSAFLGGIAMNYDTNFWSVNNHICTIEADEFDRSFLRLSPEIAVISSVDPDHLDIYQNTQNIQKSYIDFSNQINEGGVLFYKKEIPVANQLAKHLKQKFDYSITDATAHIHTSNITIVNGHYVFDVQIGETSIKDISVLMGGRHNIENALVSIAIAHYLGIDKEIIKQKILQFKGIKRRFNIYDINSKCTLIDDYAHHPSELDCLVSSVRDLFPQHKLVLLFQPHLYTRTRDFAKAFAASLSKADTLLLLDIYPARELPIQGVNSRMLIDDITIADKQIIAKEEISNWVSQHRKDIPTAFVVSGAGDIDELVNPIHKQLKSLYTV